MQAAKLSLCVFVAIAVIVSAAQFDASQYDKVDELCRGTGYVGAGYMGRSKELECCSTPVMWLFNGAIDVPYCSGLSHGSPCERNMLCKSFACGLADAHAATPTCCSSTLLHRDLFHGDYYCTGLGSGVPCVHDNMCRSGWCIDKEHVCN